VTVTNAAPAPENAVQEKIVFMYAFFVCVSVPILSILIA